MMIVVKEIRKMDQPGNLKGFAVVQVGPWMIRGLRIIQQSGQKAYIALPQERTPDGRYHPIITTTDTDLKENIQAAVLRAWSKS